MSSLILSSGGVYTVTPGGGGNTLGTVFGIAKDLPAVGSIVKSLSGIGSAIGIKSKSPRYGGGDGPLYSTVNGFIARIQSGELAVIEQLNQLRKTDADKAQWTTFWNTDMLNVPMTTEQKALVVRLDPSKLTAVVQAEMPVRPLADFGTPFNFGLKDDGTTPPTPPVTPTGAGIGVIVVVGIIAALLLSGD